MRDTSYQDITYPEVVNNIDECAEKAKANKEQIIIGTDSNAHSQLWMSETSNYRGEIFEDFITQSNLLVCNRGNKYTYDCAIGKSIIDITLVTIPLVDRIKDWKVHDEDYLSDHKLITFTRLVIKLQVFLSLRSGRPSCPQYQLGIPLQS